jgi:hypothetical protein
MRLAANYPIESVTVNAVPGREIKSARGAIFLTSVAGL